MLKKCCNEVVEDDGSCGWGGGVVHGRKDHVSGTMCNETGCSGTICSGVISCSATSMIIPLDGQVYVNRPLGTDAALLFFSGGAGGSQHQGSKWSLHKGLVIRRIPRISQISRSSEDRPILLAPALSTVWRLSRISRFQGLRTCVGKQMGILEPPLPAITTSEVPQHPLC